MRRHSTLRKGANEAPPQTDEAWERADRLGPVDIHRSQIMAPTTNNMAANDTAVFS